MGKTGINIAAELGPIARNAAEIVGQQGVAGDFVVIIQGTIEDENTAQVRWEWFWRPPTERVPSDGPVKLKDPPVTHKAANGSDTHGGLREMCSWCNKSSDAL